MVSYIKQNFESGHSLEAKELSYSEKGLEQSFRIIEKLCPPLILEDNFISCFPLKGAPLNPKSKVKLIQEGEGEPYPGEEGRNLIPFPYHDSNLKEGAGITWTDNQDGSVTIQGTSTGYSMFSLSIKLNLEVGKTYYLSQGTHLFINYLNEEGKDSWATSTLTWKNTYTFKAIYLQINPNKTVDETVWPYLNEGSLDPEWTPYANIRPIRGLNEATLMRCGKNLLPYPYLNNSAEAYGGTLVAQADGGIIASGTPTGATAFSLYKGVLLSHNLITVALLGNYTNVALNITLADNKDSILFQTTALYGRAVQINLTEYPNDTQITIVVKRAENNKPMSGIAYPMIVAGTEEPKEFELYQGDTYTVQLDNTLYAGHIDWSAGSLVITHEGKILDNVSETQETQWFIGGDTPKNKYYGIKIGELKTYKKDKIIASHYPQGIVSSNTTDNNIVGLANSSIAGRGDVILFRPNLSVFPSLKTWTDYLSNNPITVAYELTVPKIIPLTPQNITALPGLNNIWSNAEKVEIFGYANPLHIIEEQTATISNYETRIAALENAVINNN